MVLYEYNSVEINISMSVYFNEEKSLVFDGYDEGKKVKELLNDFSTEYKYTVKNEEVKKLANLLGCSQDDQKGILKEIKKRFHKNDAYTKFGHFMKENNIQFSSFIWP